MRYTLSRILESNGFISRRLFSRAFLDFLFFERGKKWALRRSKESNGFIANRLFRKVMMFNEMSVGGGAAEFFKYMSFKKVVLP